MGGEELADDDVDIYDKGGKKKNNKTALVKWSLRTVMLRKKDDEKTTAEKTQEMNLLEHVVDVDHIKEHEAEEKERQIRFKEEREASLHAKKGISVNQDEEEDRLVEKLTKLDEERDFVERKIRHAQRAQEKLADGKEMRFLIADACRMEKLNKQMERIENHTETVRQELRDLRADMEITVTVAADQQDDGEKRTMRRRRKKVEEHTVFSEDVTNFVTQVEDEYHKLAGNVLREVFGGHKQGVEDLLEAKGDPNQMDLASGWCPLHMAAANGDTEVVHMLVKAYAMPTCRSRAHGECPMHIAVRKSNISMLQTLLSVGARAVREKDNDGHAPYALYHQCTTQRAEQDGCINDGGTC